MRVLQHNCHTTGLLALIAVLAGASPAIGADAAPTLDQRAYRVCLWVQPDQPLHRRELLAAADRTFGSAWTIELGTWPTRWLTDRQGLAELTNADLIAAAPAPPPMVPVPTPAGPTTASATTDPATTAPVTSGLAPTSSDLPSSPNSSPPATATSPTPDVDVYGVMTYAPLGGRWVVRARLWQPALEWATPVLEATCADERLVVETGWQLLRQGFRPQGLLRMDVNREWLATVQGLDLASGESGQAVLQTGQLLTVTRETYTRDGPLQSRAEVPWTLLEVGEIRDGSARFRILSGLRQPLPVRIRGRTQLRVSLVRPLAGSTSIRLVVAGTAPPEPLAGLRIEQMVEVPPAPGAEGTQVPRLERKTSVLTERSGEVEVAPVEGHAWTWLTVWSGADRLAQIPFVPGAVERTQLPLPDDRPRLQVENQLASLEAQLIETVARRGVLVATMRRQAKRGDAKGALAKWDSLLEAAGNLDQFRTRIASVRTAGVTYARQTGNRASERRIEQLCSKLQGLAEQHLVPTPLNDLRDELLELQRVQADAEEAVREPTEPKVRKRVN